MTATDNPIEVIKAEYEERIKAFMEKLRTLLLNEKGFICSPVEEESYEDYRWTFVLHMGDPPPDAEIGNVREQDIDVALTLCESETWSGDKGGMSFRLDFHGHQGVPICVYAPHNYTEKVWVNVKSKRAVAARWRLFEGLDLDSIMPYLDDSGYESGDST